MRKLLFDIGKPSEKKEDTTSKTPEPVKKKRGRPKKIREEVVTVLEQPKRRGRKPKSVIVEKHVETVERQTPKQESNPWQLLTRDTKPELYQPCEFCVMKDDKKIVVAYGYLAMCNAIHTNDSYLFKMRRKYENLMFRVLPCSNISECPNEFPNCKNCKNNKKSV